MQVLIVVVGSIAAVTFVYRFIFNFELVVHAWNDLRVAHAMAMLLVVMLQGWEVIM